MKKYPTLCRIVLLFSLLLGLMPQFSHAQVVRLPEVHSKMKPSTKSALEVFIQLSPDLNAPGYNIKIKSFGELRHQERMDAGKVFNIEGIAPGFYDLVVEANGHTTLVKEDVIEIKAGQKTTISVDMLKSLTRFEKGAATKIIMCSACHKKVYMEMMRGEDADFHTGPWPGPDGKLIELPDLDRDFYPDSSPEHLAYVAPITVAAIAKQPKEKQDQCRSCHAPSLVLNVNGKPSPPRLRKENRIDGVSCATCHLDEYGNVHGKYDLSAPHPTVQDPLFTQARSAELCAACHQADASAPAQQTLKEWEADFKPNDKRTCQQCHMPREVRLFAKIFSSKPKRAIGRHHFAGGHSPKMLQKAATLSIVKDPLDPKMLQIGITNSGAGHSLPTGYAPRAIILHAKITGPAGEVVFDSSEFGALAVYTVNPALEPEINVYPAIRAGFTEYVKLPLGQKTGRYQVEASLYYDLDRLEDYNDSVLPRIASLEVSFSINKE